MASSPKIAKRAAKCLFRFEKKILHTKDEGERCEEMKTKTTKVLPKTAGEIINGGLYLQRVRCGKQNCKCARGETHSAYYFFTRRCGKLVKLYVRKSEVSAFSEMVNLASAERAQRRESARTSGALLKHLRESSREYEQMTKLYKEQYFNEQS